MSSGRPTRRDRPGWLAGGMSISASAAPAPRTAPGITAGSALVLGVLAAAGSFAGGYSPVSIAVVAVGGALAPALAVTSLTLLYRRPLGLGRAATAVVIAGSLLAFLALTLGRASFSVGMEEGDRGEPRSLFGSLTAQFFLAALLAAVASTVPVARQLLRGGGVPRPVRVLLIAVTACTAGPTVLLTMLTPQTPALAGAGALLLVALVGPRLPAAGGAPGGGAGPVGGAPSSGAEPVAAAGPDGGAGPRVLARRVLTLALGALLFGVAVWAGGVATSIGGAGTPVATSALGYAAATAQLAAVPLVIAGTLLVAARAGGGAARLGAVVAIVVVATASALMVALYDPASDAYVLLAVVIALGAGCWIGAAAWQLNGSRRAADRAVVAVAAGAVGALLYLATCSFPGGLGLLALGGCLLFGGWMLAPGRAKRLSPATLPAS
jgi:hypothetical protein